MKQIFDATALNYDADFSNSLIGKAQRKQTWKHLLPLLNSKATVLEINCGTGVDAVYIAPKVKTILATDISTAMLAEVEKKKTALQLNNCTIAVLDVRALDALIEKDYDLIFSNFGGLNCLSPQELQKFSADAFSKLKPGGNLCLVFIAKKCMWERIFFRFRQTTNRGRRTLIGGTPTIIAGASFLTHYYSVEELKRSFTHFQFIKAAPIGLFVPPGFLEKKINKPLLAVLSALDKVFTRFKGTADYGDHVLVLFQKI
jgi:ubiquinone/menaquinone biosynthesis C-methylase UbiE